MISIQNVKKGMVFSLPAECLRDAETETCVHMTEVTTSDGKVHELRSASPLYFTVLFVDSFDCGRVMIGIGDTHAMNVRMDYIQKYGDMVMPWAKKDAKPGEQGGQQVLGERVFESEGLALAIHNAEDVATMREVILHIYGYIVKGLPLPPLMVDSFHDDAINTLVAGIYEHAIEEGRTIPLRKDSGSMNE